MKAKEREKEKKAYERWTEIREKGKKREWADERWKMDENEEERNIERKNEQMKEGKKEGRNIKMWDRK